MIIEEQQSEQGWSGSRRAMAKSLCRTNYEKAELSFRLYTASDVICRTNYEKTDIVYTEQNTCMSRVLVCTLLYQ